MDVLAFWVAFAIVVYAGLMWIAPSVARVWLCFCGAAGGGFFMAMAVFLVSSFFLHGWTGFGFFFWFGPLSFIVGAGLGFLLTLLLVLRLPGLSADSHDGSANGNSG